MPTARRLSAAEERVALFGCQILQMGLELEPSAEIVACPLKGLGRILVGGHRNGSGRLGDRLHLAATFERDEPPGRGFDALSHRDEAVVLVNQGLLVS